MVVQFNIPFKVFKRFKEKSKPNGEILAFLAGFEKNDVITVSHIIFPIQYHPGSDNEVKEKGKISIFIKFIAGLDLLSLKQVFSFLQEPQKTETMHGRLSQILCLKKSTNQSFQ